MTKREDERLWFAVMVDEDDNDWGTGSFDKQGAIRKMHEVNDSLESNGLGRTAYIVVIDGCEGNDGGVAIDEIRE